MSEEAIGSRISFLLAVGLFLGWYYIASNYDYNALAGTYVLESKEESSILILNADHTFEQLVKSSGRAMQAKGTWQRYGEAHVSFSSEFVKPKGEEVNHSGEAHGEFRKTLGLWPTLILAPLEDGPKYRRKVF